MYMVFYRQETSTLYKKMENKSDEVNKIDLTNTNTENQINATGVNESEIQAMTESTVMIHSTPIVVQNVELNVSGVTDDSGIQLTPILTNKNNQPDSNDIMSILRAISRDINEVKNDFTEVNVKFDVQNAKFDKLSSDVNELKEQNKEVKNNLNEQNNKVDALCSDCLLYTSYVMGNEVVLTC